MQHLANDDNIQAWSTYSREKIDAFGDEGDASRQYILNPVIFSLLGDVSGQTILDAGCRTGYLCRLLANRGAKIIGIEPASSLFEYAREREATIPLGIQYIQEDLSKLISFSSIFDVVIANMVFMDIPDYIGAIRNCIKALKKGGHFLFSLLHPCFDERDSSEFIKGYNRKGYIRIEEYLQEFAVQQSVGYYIHRPLSNYINLVINEGCTIAKIIEPTLTTEGIRHLGENERNMHVPNFIVISAHKT